MADHNSIMDTDDAKARFLKADLAKSDSVTLAYPVDERRGQSALVPLHLRAPGKNPLEIDASIRAFRNMRQHTQDQEKQKWRSMTKSQKDSFKENYAFLCDLREKILCGEVSWSEVAKPVLGPDELLMHAEATRRANRKKRKTLPSNADVPRTVTPLPEESDLGDDMNLRSDTPTEMVVVRRAAAIPPLVPPQTMRPIIRTEDQDTVMLGDSAEDRAAEAGKQRKKAKANRGPKREKGSGTAKVYQRADAVSNDAVWSAEALVALAADTIRPCSTNAYADARRAFLSIDINWCRDSRAVGGVGFADSECKREKPEVTVVGASNKEELMWVLGQLLSALKHGDASDLNVVATSDELSTHKMGKKLVCVQPSKTPVSGERYLANRHNRLS